MYADDLLVIISLPLAEAAQVLLHIMAEMKAFSLHTGLHVNKGKSAILLKGDWLPQSRALLSKLGMPIQTSIKYLGILLGHVTAEQFFPLALNKALSRAYAMRSWELTLPEHAELLKLWILPLLVHPARAVLADKNVCFTLSSTVLPSKRAPGVSHSESSHFQKNKGYALAAPKTFLQWQIFYDVLCGS